ncbi:unnamed protein product [Adineta steineri]|uniref:Uncharacterized protein n=1 Tax=Adineta steineri TaxID=433720 RepID=A0A818VV26_9BILA|nr:unnamed protein product [Adineta steineri]
MVGIIVLGMSLMYKKISEREGVLQDDYETNSKSISTDELGPSVLFLAEPNENERLSESIAFISDNGLFIYIKIGINGFGLLGQHIRRCALQKGIQVVAING